MKRLEAKKSIFTKIRSKKTLKGSAAFQTSITCSSIQASLVLNYSDAFTLLRTI